MAKTIIQLCRREAYIAPECMTFVIESQGNILDVSPEYGDPGAPGGGIGDGGEHNL